MRNWNLLDTHANKQATLTALQWLRMRLHSQRALPVKCKMSSFLISLKWCHSNLSKIQVSAIFLISIFLMTHKFTCVWFNVVNNLMPGGIFPFPPSVVSILSQLPPPVCFRGPFVNIDEVASIYKTSTAISLSDSSTKPECLLSNEAKSYLSLAFDASESLVYNSTGTKRQLAIDEDDEGDGDGSNLLPPQFDIYRSRQLQKKPRNWLRDRLMFCTVPHCHYKHACLVHFILFMWLTDYKHGSLIILLFYNEILCLAIKLKG